MAAPLTTLRRRLAAEDGFALILALGTMVVLTVTVTTLVYYSSNSARTSSFQGARQNAYALAESGLANALSRLSNSGTPNTQAALPICSGAPASGTATTGTFTYCGTLTGSTWLLSATGTMRNPSGAASVKRTLTRSVTITGSTGGSVGAWNRIYSDATGNCALDIPNGVPVQGSVAVKGDLCLNKTSVTGATSVVQVGGKVTMTPGSSTSVSDYTRTQSATGWTGPGNVTGDDALDASQVIAGGATSTYFYATGLGFAIPESSMITGIEVWIQRKSTVSNALKTSSEMLMKANVPVGNNLAPVTAWTNGYVNEKVGTGTLWGTTWTPAEVNNPGFGVRYAVQNTTGAASTALIDYIWITVTYTADSSLGTVDTPLQEVAVASTCKWSSATAHTPCTATDHVYASSITTPGTIAKPTLDWTYWYNNAAPGPKKPCTTSTGTPPKFDSNTTYDGTMPEQELTPESGNPNTNGGTTGTPNKSYTCIVNDAGGNRIGELSWNMQTRVLTIYGTVFFDGDAVFHDHDGFVVHYQGRATIFISGKWHNDEAICAGGSGYAVTCRSLASISNWDPTENLLVLAIGAKNTGDDMDFHTDYSAFQGVLYATNKCKFHNTAMMSGPFICGSFAVTETPGFYAWPTLTALLTGQSMADPSTATNFAISLGSQSG